MGLFVIGGGLLLDGRDNSRRESYGAPYLMRSMAAAHEGVAQRLNSVGQALGASDLAKKS